MKKNYFNFSIRYLMLMPVFSILLAPGYLWAQGGSSKSKGGTSKTKVAPAPAGPVTFTPAMKKTIDSLVAYYVSTGFFSGVVTFTTNNNPVPVYNSAYGMASMELQSPNTVNTRFEIGSMSKQFCAELVLIALKEHKIKSLQDTIGTYLPYTKNAANSFGWVVNIQQLLDMTSGIPSYDNFPNFINTVARQDWIHEKFIMDQCAYPLATPPGSIFNYSDGNYYILGAMLEKLYNMPFSDLLQQKIFNPLGMTNSGFLKFSSEPNGGQVIPNLNNGYQPMLNDLTNLQPNDYTWLPKPTSYQKGAYTNMSGVAYASGAVYMTGEDFIKWTIALNNFTLLDSSIQNQMFYPWTPNVLQNYYVPVPGCGAASYGYAMITVPHKDPYTNQCIDIKTHGGLSPGYASVGLMLRNPNPNVSIFVSSNINSDVPLYLSFQIMNVLYGWPLNWNVYCNTLPCK